MRVLVTGATGLVGGRVAAALRDRGEVVVAAVRTPSAALAALGVEQLPVGLDLDAQHLDGVEAIVHAAAGFGPELDDARRVNTHGTRRLCAAALAAGTPRLVHISTTSVYDLEAAGERTVDEDAPLVRDGAASPPGSSSGSAYAITKAEAEAEVAEVTAQGVSSAVLRPPAVLGAGPTSTWGTRVPRRLLEGTFGARDPQTTFGYVHLDDLVDATLAALDTDARVVTNVVGGHTTLGAYIEAVAARLPGEVIVPSAEPDAPAWRGRYAADRLERQLGVRAERTFDAAMSEIAASWRDGAPDDTTSRS